MHKFKTVYAWHFVYELFTNCRRVGKALRATLPDTVPARAGRREPTARENPRLRTSWGTVKGGAARQPRGRQPFTGGAGRPTCTMPIAFALRAPRPLRVLGAVVALAALDHPVSRGFAEHATHAHSSPKWNPLRVSISPMHATFLFRSLRSQKRRKPGMPPGNRVVERFAFSTTAGLRPPRTCWSGQARRIRPSGSVGAACLRGSPQPFAGATGALAGRHAPASPVPYRLRRIHRLRRKPIASHLRGSTCNTQLTTERTTP